MANEHDETNNDGHEKATGMPWLHRYGSGVALAIGIAVVAIATVLAFTGHDAAACAFVVVGAGLVFVSTFSHRIHGETSLGPNGFKTFVLEQTESVARGLQLPEEQVSTAKALGAYGTDVYESALQSGFLSSGAPWKPSPAMYTTGTATQIARQAVQAAQGNVQDFIPTMKNPVLPTESFTFQKST